MRTLRPGHHECLRIQSDPAPFARGGATCGCSRSAVGSAIGAAIVHAGFALGAAVSGALRRRISAAVGAAIVHAGFALGAAVGGALGLAAAAFRHVLHPFVAPMLASFYPVRRSLNNRLRWLITSSVAPNLAEVDPLGDELS